MKPTQSDFYQLNQVSKLTSSGQEIDVNSINKENFSQSILDNVYFKDFNNDGYITYEDYLIAWNWVMQGKPSSVDLFIKNKSATPDTKTIPIHTEVKINYKKYDTNITSDWDNDKFVGENESNILAKYILAQPKSVDEFNRIVDNNPKAEILPNLLSAKYDYENKDKIDWNDLIIFNEWLRQEFPTNFTEFNENSISGMDWYGDDSTNAWLLLLDGTIIPIKLNQRFSGVRAAYLILENRAPNKIRARINYTDTSDQGVYDKVSGLDRGITTGTNSHRAFPPRNAFDDRFPRPFEVGHEAGSNLGAWLARQTDLGSAFIQYEFNQIPRKISSYTLTSAFASPPSQWKLYAAEEGVDTDINENWELIDEVNPQYDYVKTNILGDNENVIITSSSYSEFGPENINDNNDDTYFRGLDSDLPNVFISYQFDAPQKVVEYDITAPTENFDINMASSWKLQGNNETTILNENSWTTLHSVDNEINWKSKEKRRYYIPNPDYYDYYRILITTTTFLGEYVELGEVELFDEGTGERVLLDWPRGTQKTFNIDNPGEYKFYKFIFEDVHDNTDKYFGLFEIELYGSRPNTYLIKFSELSDGRNLYPLPWKILRGIYTDVTLPPLEYDLIGYGSDDFDDVYIGAENL